MSDMYDWANNEVKLYYNKFKDEDEDFNYNGECALSALKAYKSLLNDGHSGYSIRMTKAILDRLIDGKPLTLIEDTPESWNEVAGWDGQDKVYQCKRMSSLFKKVKTDGAVIFSDNNRVLCKDKNGGSYYSNEFLNRYITNLYPITFPYTGDDRFVVYTDEYLVDPKEGDFDHVAVLALYKNDILVKDFKPRLFDFTGDDVKEVPYQEYLDYKKKLVDEFARKLHG